MTCPSVLTRRVVAGIIPVVGGNGAMPSARMTASEYGRKTVPVGVALLPKGARRPKLAVVGATSTEAVFLLKG